MDRRRMMMSGQDWAKEPLVIYKRADKALSNGSVVSKLFLDMGTTELHGSTFSGLLTYCGGGETGRTGWFVISLEGTDIRKYRKLVAKYEVGLTKGYVYPGSAGIKFGYGFSESREFAEYQSPEASSHGGTFVFDISKIKDPIYLYCEIPKTVLAYDFETYGLGYMLFSDIHLE